MQTSEVSDALEHSVITMSMREVDRFKVVQAVIDRVLRVGIATDRLGITRRQLERLLHWLGGLESRQRTAAVSDWIKSEPPQALASSREPLILAAPLSKVHSGSSPACTANET
jgi:hypothetical protein